MTSRERMVQKKRKKEKNCAAPPRIRDTRNAPAATTFDGRWIRARPSPRYRPLVIGQPAIFSRDSIRVQLRMDARISDFEETSE